MRAQMQGDWELKPITSRFDVDALAVNGLDRDRLMRLGEEPETAMPAAAEWVDAVAAGAGQSSSRIRWRSTGCFFTGTSRRLLVCRRLVMVGAVDIRSLYMGTTAVGLVSPAKGRCLLICGREPRTLTMRWRTPSNRVSFSSTSWRERWSESRSVQIRIGRGVRCAAFTP